MKLSITLFAVLFYVVLVTSAPVADEPRDKRHLFVGPAPAVVPIPLFAPAPLVHGPLVFGPHWGSHLTYEHPNTIVKYW